MQRLRHSGKGILATVLVLTLAACEGGGQGFLAGLSRSTAPQTTRLAAGRIKVQGPAGFCIDKSTKLETSSGSFVVLGSCASISGNPDDAVPRILAMLTVTVSPIGEGQVATPDGLKQFFRSKEGRAALAQSGQPDDARLLDIKTTDTAVLVQAEDNSPGRVEILDDEYWRGMLTLNGHLVSLTVTALKTYPFAEQTGQRLLRSFVGSMQNANPEAKNGGQGLMDVLNSLL